MSSIQSCWRKGSPVSQRDQIYQRGLWFHMSHEAVRHQQRPAQNRVSSRWKKADYLQETGFATLLIAACASVGTIAITSIAMHTMKTGFTNFLFNVLYHKAPSYIGKIESTFSVSNSFLMAARWLGSVSSSTAVMVKALTNSKALARASGEQAFFSNSTV